MAIIAGSDEYIGTMTHISDADTNFADVVQTADLQGTDNNALQSFPTAIQGANFNDNGASTNGANGGTYDITAVTAAQWVIGGTKVASIMKFTMGAAADWTHAKGLMTVCTPQTNPTLPSDLTMTSGSTGTSFACTGVYAYDVGAQDHAVNSNYLTRTQR